MINFRDILADGGNDCKYWLRGTHIWNQKYYLICVKKIILELLKMQVHDERFPLIF